MEAIYLRERRECFFYDRSFRPQIETVRYRKGETVDIFLEVNEVVFFLKGSVRYTVDGFPYHVNGTGEFVFVPSGRKVFVEALDDSLITVFRLDRPVGLCANYSLENLYRDVPDKPQQTDNHAFSCLVINEPISHFLDGINLCVNGGLHCRPYAELKIKELFLMLRVFYPKEQLKDFLRPVLSTDTAFSEYIRANRNKYPTAIQMASSLNMTAKQFALKFRRVFGSTPYNWLKREKVEVIRRQLLTTNDPFCLIAEENGFNTLQQFSNFCKKELGASPSQIRGTHYIM